MKKLFSLILLLLPFIGNAQSFYEPSQLNVQLKVWDSDEDVIYLAQSGKPVTFGWALNGSDAGITATYYHENKFIALWIQNEQISIRTANNSYSLSSLNEALGYLEYMPWYMGIRYDMVVYDIWWNRILIPIGIDLGTGKSYAISIYFNNPSFVPSVQADLPDTDEMRYYNLQGIEVNPDNSKGQVLIQTNGRTSKKILNR